MKNYIKENNYNVVVLFQEYDKITIPSTIDALYPNLKPLLKKKLATETATEVIGTNIYIYTNGMVFVNAFYKNIEYAYSHLEELCIVKCFNKFRDSHKFLFISNGNDNQVRTSATIWARNRQFTVINGEELQ